MLMKGLALLIALSALTAGCASGNGVTRMKSETPYDRYRPYVGTPIDHFTAFRFDSWESVGPNQVVIWTGVNQAYLITVWETCRNLNFAQHIAVTSTGHTVSKMDTLRVGEDRCPIESIRPVDIKRYKEDRAALREK
jgi:hypothetical protein